MTIKTLVAKFVAPKTGDLISTTVENGTTCKTYKW